MNLKLLRTQPYTLCLLLFLLLTLSPLSRLSAQLTGTKNIPGDYATLALAITDLNTVGVGAGGVVFNVLPGNPQSAPAGGYVIGGAGSAILVGGSAPTSLANNVQINGNGNVIMASGALTAGSLTDAIFKLVGADFIGIQGCLIQENPANTVTAPATNNMTEWGIALLYVTTADGSQNNGFASNVISLNRGYTNTWGIYSNTRHSATTVGTTAEIVNNTTGPNSGNRVYGNTISNVNMGIAFIGAGTTAANMDIGNDIGGTSAITGNTISNWGGAAAASTYISNSGVSYCIFMNHQTASNVSFNSITSAAVSGTAVTLRGIAEDFTVSSPLGTFTNTISNNQVVLSSGFTSGTFQHVFTSIFSATAGATLNITNNSMIGSAVTGASSSTAMVGIANTGSYGVLNITGNILRSWTSTATSGGLTGISNSGSVVTTVNISNNQIGNATGGIITFSAATSGAVAGISCTGGASTCATTIQGNDIRGIVHSVAGSSTHTYITSTGTPLTNLVSTNTFTNLNVNTTGSVTFIGHSYTMPASGSQTITGNSIVTAFNKGGAGGTVTMMTTGSSSPNGTTGTVTNNNFSNVTVTGATAITGINNNDGSSSSPAKICTGNVFSNWTGGTSTILGMNYGYVGAPTSNISNNTLTNITGQSTITAMQIGSSFNGATPLNVAGNTITNLSSTGAGGAVTGITCSNTSATININGNAISTLSTTAGSAVSGITVSGATTTNVFRNKICDLSGSNAASAVNGVLVSGGTTVNVFNNMIGDLRAPIANAANPINGLNITGGTTVNAHFNTIYIAATSSGALFGSSAVSVNTTPTVTLRDNIFVNLSTANGAAFTAAHRRSSTTLTSYAAASNNNLFYAGTPGATNVIYFDGTNNDQTLVAYKSRVASRDNSSITENPPFLSTTCGNTNFLHIDPSIATQLESGGIPITGVTDDFDGDTRNVSTPDIGADEGTFIGIDASAPAMAYTPLSFTCSFGDRTITATITDFTGVPTTGAFQPRIYFRKNAGAWFSTQGVFNSGTATNGNWTFTIVAATMGGLTGGDIVQYYLIAQDVVTPVFNIGSNPGAGLVATDVNTVTTPPTTPNSYNIAAPLNGTYTVGLAGTYPTITAAVNAYNTSCLAGPVIFSLIDATYPSETFPITVLANADASAVNTLTIKAGVPGITVAGSNAFSIFHLSGADFVTIDGSVGNTANTICPLSAATRDLTITNSLSSTSPAVVWLGATAGSDPVSNCTVKNCILSGVSPTTTILGLGLGGTAIGTGAPVPCNNNSFVNNDVRNCQFAIYAAGPSAVAKNQNITINQNVINAAAPNNIGQGGIYVAFGNNVSVSGNNIGNVISTTSSQDPVAINLGFGAVNGFSATTTGIADGMSNVTVTNNTVGVVNANTTYSAVGIGLGNTVAGTSLIANNVITGVASNGTAGDFCGGIVLGGGTAPISVLHNSVWMQGTIPAGTAASQVSVCLGVTSSTAPSALTIKNNILYNTQIGNASATLRFCAIGYGHAGPFTNSVSNYNDLFSAGAGPGTYFVGTTGTLVAGTTSATLANWQTTTSGDANSVSIAPVFVSSTDLHLIPASNTTLNDIGTPTSVTNDIDCATRSLTTPDMGADEFDPPICSGTPTAGTATVSLATVCQGTATSLSTTGFTSGVTGISFQWQRSNTPGGPYSNIAGATTSTFSYSTAPVGLNYIVCMVTCSNGGGSALTNEVTLTVNANPVTSVLPITSQLCLPGTSSVTLTASATGGSGAVTYTWNPTTGLTPTTGSPVTASPTVSTVYTVTGTDALGCLSTATATVNVGSTVTLSSVTATPGTICAGNTTLLNAAASVSTTNYSVTTVPFAPIPSGTGTTVLANAGTATTALTSGSLDDGYWNGIAMPFSFTYFGTPYNTIHVGTNGFASFTAISNTTGYGNAPQIPNTLTPNHIIGGCFGDLYWTSGGTVSTYTSGTAPNRIFVVNFNGGSAGGFYNGGLAPVAFTTFQIQFFETSNVIQIQTSSITSDGSHLHTMGIEDVGGTVGFVAPGRDNSLWSLTNNGTQFAPPGTFTYAWTPAAGLTPSAAVASPTTPALAGNTVYNVTVTEPGGCSASGNVTVTVNPTVTPSVSITAAPSNVICAGTSVTFTAVPTNGGTTPAYQWKKNGSNVGTNSTTYTDAGLVNGDLITCVLTSNAVCPTPASVTSNTITMTVNPVLVPSVSITAAPGTTICAGTSVTFTAAPTNGGTTPAYQWKKNGSNVGTNSTTYTDAGLVNGDLITCVLTSNAVCATPTTATSNTLTMTVNANVTPSVSISAAPGTTICTGTSVTFTAVPTNGGTTPAYQWKKNGGNVGTNSTTYTDAGLVNGDVITCVLTSNAVCPSPTTATSNALTISVVTNTTPTVTITASPGSTICPGSSATFTAVAVNAGLTPSYQWKLNGGNVGTNSTTYTNGALVTGNTISCVVTSSDPCALPTTATSNTITMTVADLTDPTAVCQAVTVTLNGGGTGSTTAAAVNNGSSDNCTASPTLSLSTTNFTCANLGTNTVVLTATDGAGRTGTCNATVTVVDNIGPAITCPANATANNDPGLCTAAATYATPSGTDNCTPTTTQIAGLASGANFPLGTTTNTFRVTDGSGNTATCSFTVTVSDNEAPTITCPANVAVNNDAGLCSAVVTYSAPNGADNCTGATTAQTAGLASNAVFPVGVTTNAFTVTDGAGNTATCSFNVTVTDTEAPVYAACVGNMTVSTSPTSCDTVVTWTAPTATDNCAVATSTGSSTSGSVFALGTTTVTYTAADVNGNTATCSFDITVADNTDPTATCQAVTVTLDSTGNGSTTAAAVNNGSTDLCGAVTLSLSQTAFTCADAGTANVVLTVTDGAGNTSTCSTTVNVLTQPVTSSATAAIVDCGYNVSCHGATDGVATAVAGGGCPTYTYLWSSGATTSTATGLGAGVVTVTITDGAGGTSVATVTLTEPAVVSAAVTSTTNSCTGDSTGSADITPAGGNDCSAYTFVWSNGATSEDLSGVAAGTYTVTVTDINGCTGTQSVTIGSFPTPTPVFTVASNILTSVQSWTTYQWQLNGNDIPGANASSFVATQSGDYTLVVTDANGCIGTSAPVTVTVVAVVDPTDTFMGLSIYPNPARGEFKLLTAKPITQSLTVSIFDMYGHRYTEKAMPSLGSEVAFDIHAFAAGSYMVEVVAKNGQRKLFRLVVQ